MFNRKGVHADSDCPANSDKTWIVVEPAHKLQKGQTNPAYAQDGRLSSFLLGWVNSRLFVSKGFDELCKLGIGQLNKVDVRIIAVANQMAYLGGILAEGSAFRPPCR